MAPDSSHEGEAGRWVRPVCHASNILQEAVFWVPAGQDPAAAAAAAIDPALLAQEAYDQLVLPIPEPHTSPSYTSNAVVGLPTWLWLERASWRTHRETVSVPGVTVTVQATPVEALWWMGDGRRVRCRSAGTPYDPDRHNARASSPDCGHTYRRASDRMVGERYRASVTTRWQVRWTVTGAAGGGRLPDLTRTARLGLRVIEVQTIN